MKKLLIASLVLCSAVMQGLCAFAYDTSTETLRQKHMEFASQYEYHEGDTEKTFELYPGIIYTSGVEVAADGSLYECPAIYADAHAAFANDFSLQKGKAKFIINGAENKYTDQCILYNDRLLVPVSVFTDVGCYVDFNEATYVATISRNGTVLEILPNLTGMRKNQDNGFYVPLEVCARFVDDILYVPVRAVAEELELYVSWDAVNAVVTLNSAG